MELMVILVLALVVLGPQRIPEVAANLGKAIRGFRKATRELREHIDIEDEVRKPFEDLRAALRDEPSRYKPAAAALVTASGDPDFPNLALDPHFMPPGAAPVHGVSAPATPGEVSPAVHEPSPVVAVYSEVAAEPAVAEAPAGPASLVGPPEEPVVSANSGADHFQRAAQAASPTKGAS